MANNIGYENEMYCGAEGEQDPNTDKQARKKQHSHKIVALALCCSILGGVIGAGGTALGAGVFAGAAARENGTTILEGQREYTELNVAYINTNQEMTAAEIYAANVNSTVGITTSITTNFFGYQTTSPASGSGFILTGNGYIATNYHVIEKASSIRVTTYDDSSYDAELIGYDESNDLAVLKIEATDLTPVILGDSDKTNVGDGVIAIGNPLGELTFSLTSGAVSALDREVTLSNGAAMKLMQTDCAINSGNSGGALFNMHGEVIGITNAKYASNSSSGVSIDNIGFAIPINSVRNVIESIIEKGYVSKPYLGVSVGSVSNEMQRFGLPQGAAVQSVTENSPAESAGLRANDIITEVNGSEITSGSDLKNVILGSAIGDELILTVYRQGETIKITVSVAEQQAATQESPADQEQEQDETPALPWLGSFK